MFNKIPLLGTLLFLSDIVMAYEEPDFKLVHETDIYDVRLYDERVVAQVSNHDGNTAFGVLFDYISGENRQGNKISMTIPVTQSVEMDMTTPVTTSSSDGKPVMRFFLPAKYTLSTAPVPTDQQVTLLSLPPEYLAVIQYSGFASDNNFREHTEKLKEALEKEGIRIIGSPIKATYNSPFTLPFFRRNEAMIKIEWPINAK